MGDDGLAIFEQEKPVTPTRSAWQWIVVVLAYTGVWAAIILTVLGIIVGAGYVVGWTLNQYPHPL